jgi:SAM-dependent methyltransferase
MTEWYEDDTFWSEVAPLLFDEERMEQTEGEVDDLLELLDLPEGGAVLDQACGVGRHALEFARRGYRATGVDMTEGLLERARQAARDEELDIECVAADMREFVRPVAFDGAINLFSSFGYFADPEDDRRVARNVFDSLKPGASFVIDTMGREVVARDFVEQDWRQIGGIKLLEHRHIEQDWGWIRNDWTVLDGQRVYECSWGIRLYAGTELRALLLSAGFEKVTLFGNLSGSPYDPEADRLIAAARKRSSADR